MRILGIDPGTSLIGYGIVDISGNKYSSVAYGTCVTPPKIPSRERVSLIYDFFDKLIKKHKPNAAAIESLFYFKNAKTVISVSEIRGVLLLVSAHHNLPVREFTPLQVKVAIAQYGRAEKSQIQTMVRLILDLKDNPKPDDVADALALAICYGNTNMY